MPKIDIDRLRELNESISFCDTEYNASIDESLNVPQEIKDAWKAHSIAKAKFASVLSKYNINLI